MGPRTSIRGNSRSVVTGCVSISRFNGAADFHPRKRRVPRRRYSARGMLQWGRGLPSAETSGSPRPGTGQRRFNGAADFHPRKRAKRPPGGGKGVELQWGRGLPSAETRLADRTWGLSVPASMGPRTSIRGNIAYAEGPDRPIVASMGPRTSIRGNSGSRSYRFTAASLQWGRGLPSAETSSVPMMFSAVNGLQWSRGLPSAETRIFRHE